MQGIDMMAFYEELEKIAATQVRSETSVWSSKTVGAPRSKLPGKQAPKAPTTPGKLSPKLVSPAGYGKRQNYSQPNPATTPETNPAQQAGARQTPPPNVVFGVR